jgi:thiol-disulfide isomerase/thioredoxin
MSDLKGKVVLLNFWGTWCGPCRVEIPDFIRLYDKYHESGLEIVGITLPRGARSVDPKQIQRFMDNWQMNYTVLTDIKEHEAQASNTTIRSGSWQVDRWYSHNTYHRPQWLYCETLRWTADRKDLL